MVYEAQATKLQALNQWFKTPQGEMVASAFFSELLPLSSQFKGDVLLQLGSAGENLWLPHLNYRHQWIVSPAESLHATVISSLTKLPFERDSIDCILAPLVLEAFPHDKNPISEMERILRPLGYLILFGINPLSFWGGALRYGLLSCFGTEKATLYSSLGVQYTLMSRGFRQCSHSRFGYIPPISNQTFLKKASFFNEMGKMIWPFPAGFYCLIVQKYQPCLSRRMESVANEGFIVPEKSRLQAT